MKLYLALTLALTVCTGCSVVNEQHYYVPNQPHTTTRDNRTYLKTIYSNLPLTDSDGQNIGVLKTSNGMGTVLLMGPPYVPVVPIGVLSIFVKSENCFQMDFDVQANNGYLMSLAIDSSSFKSITDSLNTRKKMTAAFLKTNGCYMIVNGSKKVPLKVKEYFTGTSGHHYRLVADIRFWRVRTATIITGNALLDRNLKNIIFERKKRLTYLRLGLS